MEKIIDLLLRNSKWELLKGRQRFIILILTNGSAWSLISVLLSFGWLSSAAERREVVKCEKPPVWYLKLSVSKQHTCTRTRSDVLDDPFFNLPQSISLKWNSQSLVGNSKMEIILLWICLCLYEGFAAPVMEGILLCESQLLKGDLLMFGPWDH